MKKNKKMARSYLMNTAFFFRNASLLSSFGSNQTQIFIVLEVLRRSVLQAARPVSAARLGNTSAPKKRCSYGNTVSVLRIKPKNTRVVNDVPYHCATSRYVLIIIPKPKFHEHYLHLIASSKFLGYRSRTIGHRF